MEYEQLSKSYEYGLSKIYEMVINNNPSYAYLLEGNARVDQKLVMAHVFGHVDFFKNNYCFRRHQPEDDGRDGQPRRPRDRAGCIDRLRRWSITVEDFIDRCLSLENLIDSTRRSSSGRRGARRPRTAEREADEVRPVSRPPRVHGRSSSTRKEYLEAQRKKLEAERQKQKRVPGAARARRAARSCSTTRPLERWERDVLDDHPRRGLLLRAAGADQDHERGLGVVLALHRS